jgi:acyl-CoA thioesterase FadM
LLLEAEVRHVWIDPVTRAKTPMPDWAREGLAPWHVPA